MKLTEMYDAYKQGGLSNLYENYLKEEPTTEEYEKEIKKAQDKSEGKETSDVAKAAVQSVEMQKEDTDLEEQRFEKGEDIGENGKNFKKIEKEAAKRYGSEESGKKVAGAILKKVLTKEDEIEEKELTKNETEEKEKVVKGMKKGLKGFKERYGDRAEAVMYATATKIAKEKE